MTRKPGAIQGSFDFDAPPLIKEIDQGITHDDAISWITVSKGIPYFLTEKGNHWQPIGQNDSITWPDLAGVFKRKDLAAVESYFRLLSRSGVTCIRLMLEYCQGEHRYLENPVGYFQPNMVKLWDDIFDLCGKHGLRILLTPYDTFWMWRRWKRHPYNTANSGRCNRRSQWLLCAGMRDAIKARLHFATHRWGGSGVLFAWDLWNEIRPAHGGNSARGFAPFIEDISGFLRKTELELHGRSHPQTVSVFSPVLQKDQHIAESTFRNPLLDFASIHLYENNTIDNPRNTVDAAVSTGRLTREVLAHINDRRPFFDSEHGPIKLFNERKKTLPELFDDEYFRHMQWAHLASGGTGGGLRWPYRHPHRLTTGMRYAQSALKAFIPLIRWNEFKRVNLNHEIKVSDPGLQVFGCGDERQAIVWLLRTNAIGKNRMVKTDAGAAPCNAIIPLLARGRYTITLWNTGSGSAISSFAINHTGNYLQLALPPVFTNLAIAVVSDEW
ncbi:MAG: hypothetical protein WKF89_01340 [Chitinophagaceae bacterium]